jgi:hypothetical protein
MSSFLREARVFVAQLLFMDYAIQTLNANAVLCNNLFISLWSCHLFYFGDVVVYVYICDAVVVYNLLFDMSLHFGAQ